MVKRTVGLTALWLALLWPCAVTAARAQAGGGDKGLWEVGAEISYDSLSDGFAPWRSGTLSVSRRTEAGQAVFGSYRETSRFGLRDRDVTAGFRRTLGKRWAVQSEAGFSETHRVLPKWTAQAQLEHIFGRGWVAQGSFRHSAYNADRTNLGAASIERYFGRYRAGYTLYVGASRAAGVSAAHRVAGDYYYGERSSVGVSLAAGRELVNLGGARGILRTAAVGASVNGRHWFTPRWGVSWDLGLHRQGDIYTRRGLVFGVRYRL
jgi:YaiO family outer membrane protein